MRLQVQVLGEHINKIHPRVVESTGTHLIALKEDSSGSSPTGTPSTGHRPGELQFLALQRNMCRLVLTCARTPLSMSVCRLLFKFYDIFIRHGSWGHAGCQHTYVLSAAIPQSTLISPNKHCFISSVLGAAVLMARLLNFYNCGNWSNCFGSFL